MIHQWEAWGDCIFCKNFISMSLGNKKAFFEPYPSITKAGTPCLVETENFILIPDIAPLSEDHVLLISKHHIPSFAAISEYCLDESEDLIKRTVTRMKEFHPTAEIFIFEHGVGHVGEQIVKCGSCNRTDHAHLHMLPLPITREEGVASILTEQILKDHPLIFKIAHSFPFLSFRKEVGEYPYLLLWSSLDISKTYLLVQDSLDYTIPSQVIRKLLALQALGLHKGDSDRWDWRNLMDLYPQEMENKLRNTIQRWGLIKEG